MTEPVVLHHVLKGDGAGRDEVRPSAFNGGALSGAPSIVEASGVDI
jgi:hypothetical protein